MNRPIAMRAPKPLIIPKGAFIPRPSESRSISVGESYSKILELSGYGSSALSFNAVSNSHEANPGVNSIAGFNNYEKSGSFFDSIISKVDSLITDYGDLAYTAFTFSNIGATYDTISQYSSGEIGGLQAAAMLGAGLFFGSVGSKSVGAAFKVVNGNSKLSTKAQHGYVIYDRLTGKAAKVGVSGGKLNKNGISRRANFQANK